MDPHLQVGRSSDRTAQKEATDTLQAIEARGLTKRFDEVVAVDNLDLAIEQGTVYGFLGPNGWENHDDADVNYINTSDRRRCPHYER